MPLDEFRCPGCGRDYCDDPNCGKGGGDDLEPPITYPEEEEFDDPLILPEDTK